MTFNWEFSIGSILAILTVAGGMAGFYFGTRYDLRALNKALETGMGKLDKNIETMNKVVMDLALSTQRQDNFEKRTDDRFSRLEEDIREMKHGKGFVQN